MMGYLAEKKSDIFSYLNTIPECVGKTDSVKSVTNRTDGQRTIASNALTALRIASRVKNNTALCLLCMTARCCAIKTRRLASR